MATGQPLRTVLGAPAEVAMWERFFERRPPGDPIVRVLVARIGVLLETFMSDPKSPPRPMTPEDWDRYYRWHFWEERPEELPSEAQQEQDDIRAAWGDAYQTIMAETDGN